MYCSYCTWRSIKVKKKLQHDVVCYCTVGTICFGGTCCCRCGAAAMLPRCFDKHSNEASGCLGAPTRTTANILHPYTTNCNWIETENVDRAGTHSRWGHTVPTSRHSVTREHQHRPLKHETVRVYRLGPGSPILSSRSVYRSRFTIVDLR